MNPVISAIILVAVWMLSGATYEYFDDDCTNDPVDISNTIEDNSQE